MSFNRRRRYTDPELQLLHREGSDAAFRELLSPHIEAVLAYARTFNGCDEDAEDISFAVFAELSAVIKRGTDVLRVRPFLKKMVRNRFIDYLRSERSRTQGLMTELFAEETQAVDDLCYDAEIDRLRDVLILEIDRLNQEQRFVISERYFFGQQVADIAAEADWSKEKVYNLLNGAKKTLRRRCLRPEK